MCNRPAIELFGLSFIPQFQDSTPDGLYMFLCEIGFGLTETLWMFYLFNAGDLKLHEAVMFYMNHVK